MLYDKDMLEGAEFDDEYVDPSVDERIYSSTIDMLRRRFEEVKRGFSNTSDGLHLIQGQNPCWLGFVQAGKLAGIIQNVAIGQLLQEHLDIEREARCYSSAAFVSESGKIRNTGVFKAMYDAYLEYLASQEGTIYVAEHIEIPYGDEFGGLRGAMERFFNDAGFEKRASRTGELYFVKKLN